MLRPLLHLILAVLGMILAALAAFLLAPFLGRSRSFWTLARLYSRTMTRIWGVGHAMCGWDELPEDLRDGRRPAIFIANHASNLDPVLLACHLKGRPVFLAKLEVAFVPVLGAVTWLSGAIFINRSNRERAIQSMTRAAQRVRQGVNVVAFPEGTRSRTGELVLPFKKGVFNMAMQAGVPIVPIALFGSHQVLPPGSLRLRPGLCLLRVGRPQYPEDHPDHDSLRLASERAMEALVSEGP